MSPDADASTANDLAGRFIASASDIVTVDGREVRSLYDLYVEPGDALEITRLTANHRRAQAVKLAVEAGGLIVGSTRSQVVALWNTTAPRTVRIAIEIEEPCLIEIWNAWQFGGVEHAWIGNAGMSVSLDDQRATLQCSDGIGPVDFTDLVVIVDHIIG